MAKSHAERQKEYRERKKAAQGSNWLKKESNRTKKYYVKTALLDEHDARKRRRKLRKKQADYRKRLKLLLDSRNVNQSYVNSSQAIEPQAGTSFQTEQRPSTSNREQTRSSAHKNIQYSDISSSESRMVVKLPCFVTKSNKSSNKSSKKYRNKIDYLKNVTESLKKKNKSLRQKLYREKQRKRTDCVEGSPKTPKSKSQKYMKEAGIDPTKHPKLRKKLIFADCLAHEMKRIVLVRNRNSRSAVKKIVAGSILRKYNITQYAASLVGVRVRSKKPNTGYQKKNCKDITYKKIRTFLEREDNARQLPGKADSVKNEKKEHVQKYVLNDYMRNIYLKFKAENPHVKVSFATFCRGRPKHVTFVNYAARITCLCTRHQNFALKLQCLKRYKVTQNTSPDSFSESTDVEELREGITSVISEESVVFKEWRRIKCDDGKVRTKLLDYQKEKEAFTEQIVTEFEDFKNHASRVKQQYQSFKQMKESLRENTSHVCIQMDFAENYSVKEMEEIQSAYWNPESVTLHPVVMYYNENGIVTHSSMVIVSDVPNHNSTMVQAILEKVIQWVKGQCKHVKFVHYWTDSPTSQYRNKTMFDIVARHPTLFGVKASWQYFEAGHGKGACDGIGGVVKRSADTALKTGKVSITNAKDFFDWGVKTDSKIKYLFVERKEYDNANKRTESRQKQVNTVKGTLKLHAIVGLSETEIMVNKTTCVCSECFTENGFVWCDTNQCGWEKVKINIDEEGRDANNNRDDREIPIGNDVDNRVNREIQQVNDVDERVDREIQQENDTDGGISRENDADREITQNIVNTGAQIVNGDFVAANYDGVAYVGKVIDVDNDSYEVTFMEQGSKVKDCLKWPTKADVIWIDAEDIICKVKEPISTGKGKRWYKLTENDKERIDTFGKH